MSFRKLGRIRKRIDDVRVEMELLKKQADGIRALMAGLPGALADIRIEMMDMFPGRGTSQEQMNALLGVPRSTPPGEGLPSIPTTTLQGRPGIAWGELFTPEQTLAGRGMAGAANLQEANAFADRLEATAKRFEAGFPNSYFTAVVLKMEIPYLRIGARSVLEAKEYIKGFGVFFLPGFQKAAADPNMSPTARALTQEAIQILMTGEPSGAGGAGGGFTTLTAGARPTVPIEGAVPAFTTASFGGATTGGIGGGAAGAGAGTAGSTTFATRSDIAALGATITRTAEQQTTTWRGISAAVTAQTNAVRTATQEANNRLAEQFRSIHGWQQRVETGYFRPMNEGITEVRRNAQLGARQTMDLAAALERLQLSGALSPGSSV